MSLEICRVSSCTQEFDVMYFVKICFLFSLSLKRIEKYLINSLGTTFEISHEDKNQTKMFSLSRMSCLTKKSKWFVCELGFLLSININLKGEDRFCHHAKSSIRINRIWQWVYLQQKLIVQTYFSHSKKSNILFNSYGFTYCINVVYLIRFSFIIIMQNILRHNVLSRHYLIYSHIKFYLSSWVLIWIMSTVLFFMVNTYSTFSRRYYLFFSNINAKIPLGNLASAN